MDKTAFRKVVKQRKRQFSSYELEQLSLSICKTLLSHSKIKNAKTILLYASLPDEVNTNLLLQTFTVQQKCLLLPVVVDSDTLELHQYTSQENLKTGAFGIKEPTSCIFTDYHLIDVALVPGVAFDANNNRLGRGKGYYDKLLANLPHTYKIGIAFPFQVFPYIPTTEQDIRMNEVVYK